MAKLVINKPGVLNVIDLPISYLQSVGGVVNFKTLLRGLQKKQAAAEAALNPLPSSSSSSSSSSSEATTATTTATTNANVKPNPAGPVFKDSWHNHFIENLERKFCSQYNYEEDDSDDQSNGQDSQLGSRSEGDEEDEDEKSQIGDAADAAEKPKAKRKRRPAHEYYVDEDGGNFIDDR